MIKLRNLKPDQKFYDFYPSTVYQSDDPQSVECASVLHECVWTGVNWNPGSVDDPYRDVNYSSIYLVITSKPLDIGFPEIAKLPLMKSPEIDNREVFESAEEAYEWAKSHKARRGYPYAHIKYPNWMSNEKWGLRNGPLHYPYSPNYNYKKFITDSPYGSPISE